VTLDEDAAAPMRVTDASDTASPRARRPAGGGSAAAHILAQASVLPAVLAASWLIAALPLVLFHIYRPVPATVLGLGLAAALGRPAVRVASARAESFGRMSWWVLIGVLVVVVGFGVLAYAHSASDVLVRRDPGSYAMSAYWLAKHGTIQMPDHAAAFRRDAPNLLLVSQGFYGQGSHVIPQFMTGAPILLAVGGWFAGIEGVLHANAFIGMFALLAFAGLTARLVGPRWAPFAALTLALVQPELDVLRATYSEPAAQLILLGGLVLVVDALARDRAAAADRGRVLLVAGIVLGLVSVVRIDAVADLIALVPFVGWLAFHHRKAWRPLAIGLALGLLAGAFDCVVLTLPYTKHVGSDLVAAGGGFGLAIPLTIFAVRAGWAARGDGEWSRAWIAEVVLVAGLGAAGALAAVLPLSGHTTHVMAVGAVAGAAVICCAALRAVWWCRRHPDRTRSAKWPAAAAILVLLVGVFFAVRPHLMTARAGADSGGAYYVQQVQAILHMPLDRTRSYYEQSLRWLSWYFGWTALVLALVGAMRLAYQQVAGRRREWLPVFLVCFCTAVLVLFKPSITPDHPWADRRFVPVVLPGVVLFAFAAVGQGVRRLRLLERKGWPRPSAAILRGAVIVGGMAAIVLPAYVGSRDVFWTQTEKGEIALVANVCAQIQPNDVVVALGNRASAEWPGTLGIVCGVPVAGLADPTDDATLRRLDAYVRGKGGRVIMMADGDGDRDLAPLPVQWPSSPLVLDTTEVAHTLVSRPGKPWSLPFNIWLGPLRPTNG
jgi:hypothetical protein